MGDGQRNASQRLKFAEGLDRFFNHLIAESGLGKIAGQQQTACAFRFHGFVTARPVFLS